MPCNSGYMSATRTERSMSPVACFIDELNGIKNSHKDIDGYHSKVYNQHLTPEDCDRMVSELCMLCLELDNSRDMPNVSDYSLELQIWWRDHKIADEKRTESETRQNQLEYAKRQALAKLSAEDKVILGLGKADEEVNDVVATPEDDTCTEKVYHAFVSSCKDVYRLYIDIKSDMVDHKISEIRDLIDTYAIGRVNANTVEEARDKILADEWIYTQRC